MVPFVATALAFSTIVIWFSQSRGAILSFFAMLGAFLYTRLRFRHRWAKWVLMIALAGMSAGAKGTVAALAELKSVLTEEQMTKAKEIWKKG
jgi:O-antigen ligase